MKKAIIKLKTGQKEAASYVFPRMSMFSLTLFWKTLSFSVEKTKLFPKEPVTYSSVLLYSWSLFKVTRQEE